MTCSRSMTTRRGWNCFGFLRSSAAERRWGLLSPDTLRQDGGSAPAAHILPHLGEQVRHEAAVMFVHRQMAADRGECPLLAVRALADAAAYADRYGRGGIADVEAGRIDHFRGVGSFAAKADGELAAWFQVGSGALGHATRDADIGDVIRHAGQLDQDLARLRKGFVDIPQRAGAAEPGEM